MEEIKKKFPKRNEKRIKDSFYRKEFIRDDLEKEIYQFIKNYKEPYVERLILWDGYCRLCYKEGKKCTYDDEKPCRYPKKIRYSMESVGIRVDVIAKKAGILLEWPPVNYSYRFGLVCYK